MRGGHAPVRREGDARPLPDGRDDRIRKGLRAGRSAPGGGDVVRSGAVSGGLFRKVLPGPREDSPLEGDDAVQPRFACQPLPYS
jgi:hypothetical protein